jgi:hypothetical protein
MCPNRSRRMLFCTKHPADFPSEPKVPIVWQVVSVHIQSQPISLRGRICPRRRGLQDRSSLVHFIEHGNLDD